MARKFDRIGLPGLLLISVILSGCQFHAALGPFGESADPSVASDPAMAPDPAMAQFARNRSGNSPRARQASSKRARRRSERIARRSRPARTEQLAAADPISQQSEPGSGWRPTSESPNDGIRRTSAEVTESISVNSDAQRAFADALPIPVPPAEKGASAKADATPLHPGEDSAAHDYPIDLATALRLAGGESWDVQMAVERVRQAYTRLDAAKALWLPSLVAGVGYTKHDGQIQDTRGDVIDVSRNAFFVGGGAEAGSAPLAGPSGGPARLFVDLSLADAIFEPLVARQSANAENHRHSAVYNDTLQSASMAYFELQRAQGKLAAANSDAENARELFELTEAFVLSGKGSRADIARARTETLTREQLRVKARLAMNVASAELARILRLDPETTLFAIEQHLAPLEFVDPSISLAGHVESGLGRRPEISEAQFQLDASSQRVRAEQFRPFLPHLAAGVSAGGFGGGRGNRLSGLNGRSDFDLLAVWRIRNLGFGSQADIERSESEYWVSHHRLQKLRDSIATEITQAYHAVHAQREQIRLAGQRVREADESLKQNKARIRGLQGFPLETLQSVQAVALARANHVDSIVDFNVAQARLLRATGRTLVDESTSAEPK